MDRDELKRRLTELRPQLTEFGVDSLRVFGSVSRREVRSGSDVDMLVEFNGPSTFDRYFGLLVFLEEALGVKIDLVEPEKLHPRIRESVLQEALRVA